MADLNGDGKVDMVAAARSPSVRGVAVALGNGDGTFQAVTIYPALLNALAVGDMNGDHIPDIVSAGGTILFGDGKGNFPSRRDYPPPRTSDGYVILTDFDGDGRNDIVFGSGNPAFIGGNANGSPFTVLLGSGGGFFRGSPTAVSQLNNPSFLVADFDNDGIPDSAFVSIQDNVLKVVTKQGQGNGTFGPLAEQSFTSSAFTSLRSSGDFDHDGNQDLAIVSLSTSQTQLLIYRGRGDGTFDAPVTTFLGFATLAGIADLNNDGFPDLVTTSDSISIWLGKGDGTFSAVAAHPAFGFPDMTTLGLLFSDFNRDGKQDMVVAISGANSVMLLLGKGDGTFSEPQSVGLPYTISDVSRGLAVADFNGDGRVDLAVELDKPGGNALAIMLAQADGTFSAILTSSLLPVQAADINGDKIPDLVGISTPNGFGIRLGNGDGTFQAPYEIPSGGFPVAFADLNRDGVIDIVSSNGSGVLISLLNLSRPAAPLTIVSAASYEAGPLAPGSIAAAFGPNLAPATVSASGSLPYTLSGITVGVQDALGATRPAPLFFVSRSQLNFQVPPQTAIGPATVTAYGVLSGGNVSTQVQIAGTAPGLFTVGSDIPAAYAVQVTPEGTATTVATIGTQGANIVSVPLDTLQPGQLYLVLFGTGFDSATASSVTASIRGVPVTVAYAGPQANLVGLDQVNILVPRSIVGAGAAAVSLSVNGIRANVVRISIR